MKNKTEVRYYHSFADDFFQTKNQKYKVPENYTWVRKDLLSRFLSAVIYGTALILSSIYCRIFLHVRIKGGKKLRNVKNTGCFLYGNHTQPVGDVFNPALAAFPKRIYTVVSPANLAIPFIGKLLPYLGALPVSDTIHGMKELNRAIDYRLEQKRCIVIYPEAHVWEYCTFIRPFPETSFKYPVKYSKPVYCMTTTYQKRHFGKKPTITIYIDGPFDDKGSGSIGERASKLRDAVFECMTERSLNSTYQYIRYEGDYKEE